MPEKENMAKRPLNVGLLAHVDAGKTTLSEALMYVSGWRRTLGRVDISVEAERTMPVPFAGQKSLICLSMI